MTMSPERLAITIAAHAADRKAHDIAALDLREVAGYTDFFVICSGNSDRQTKAIHDAIHQGLKKNDGMLPRRVELRGSEDTAVRVEPVRPAIQQENRQIADREGAGERLRIDAGRVVTCLKFAERLPRLRCCDFATKDTKANAVAKLVAPADRLDVPHDGGTAGSTSRRDLLELLQGRSLTDLDPNVLAVATAPRSLPGQETVLIGSEAPGRPLLDLARQLLDVGFDLVPVALAAYLLVRSGDSVRRLWLGGRPRLVDLGLGALLALAVGSVGLPFCPATDARNRSVPDRCSASRGAKAWATFTAPIRFTSMTRGQSAGASCQNGKPNFPEPTAAAYTT